ncbi:terminase small subunit [Shouchella lonarensis]|uniref:Phage terminase small subunit n=1 Tax=Shouchella lonarensis TaxID=1464122 RepID=A0A1G6HRX4_9BACI|nr:terminase small subunit [Shouchella lonarensis]SDB96615.1 phage terminase small subunit [Shouchella lonarensis]
MKLTEKQRRFADEYIKLGEITTAAVKAGYKPKSAYSAGSENMQKPHIKAYIDERLDKLKKQEIAEQDEILQYLTAVMRGESSGTALVGTGRGKQSVDQVPPTVTERTAAAVSLGKRYGMWKDKKQIEMTLPVFVDDVPKED